MAPSNPFIATYDGTLGHDTLWVPLPDRLTDGTFTTYFYSLNAMDGNDTLYAPSGPVNWPTFNSAADPTQPLNVINHLSGGNGSDRLYSSYRLPGLSIEQAGLYSRTDTLEGGAGNDRYFLRDNNVTILEGDDLASGSDTIVLSADYFLRTQNTLLLLTSFLNVESVTITGAIGAEVHGTDGRNVLKGDDGADTLIGGEGDDTLFSGGGADILHGDGGNDRLVGVKGNDSLHGDAGNDTLVAGEGDDLLTGGAGCDRLIGGVGNDSLDGGTEADTLIGGNDDDTLSGGDGGDFLIGGRGHDSIDGAGDNDRILAGDGNDTATGGAGLDTLIGGHGNDSLDGGDGDGDDLIMAGTGDDILICDSGNDLLIGGIGNDSLYGGIGDDRLNGGAGIDLMDGGDGNDTFFVEHLDDSVLGGAGHDIVYSDTINLFSTSYSGVERLGLYGNLDLLILASGATEAMTLTGNGGDNDIGGGAGDDILLGNAGNDNLFGGNGADTLNDGDGFDTLTGGDGADSFVFNAQYGTTDLITDFVAGTDTVDLRGTAIETIYAAQDISEHLGLTIATAIVFYDLDGLHVSLDYDGDGTSDHRIDFDNSPFEMSSSDFLITDFAGTTDPFFPA